MDQQQPFAHLFSFSGANKAGMEAIDKEKQCRVIYEMSKNSSYFKKATEKDEKAIRKADEMKASFSKIKDNPAAYHRLVASVTARVSELESFRSLQRICCVLDMDMFFAAVEIRDNPSLASVPVAVGDMSMISTANYVARK